MSDVGHNSGGVAAEELEAFVTRIERVQEEIAGLNADKSSIFKEAAGRGFDVKAMKAVIKLRAQDHAARRELEAIVDLYCSALGVER